MFAVDIDGTIAEGRPAALLDYFRETCRLALVDVPEDITWWDVFDLPEVVGGRISEAPSEALSTNTRKCHGVASGIASMYASAGGQ